MLATEHVETARAMLAEADRVCRDGDDMDAALLLWDTARYVVLHEMRDRGEVAKDGDDLLRFVKQFAADRADRRLFDSFMSAEDLSAHARFGWMESYQFPSSWEVGRQFVTRMLTLAGPQ